MRNADKALLMLEVVIAEKYTNKKIHKKKYFQGVLNLSPQAHLITHDPIYEFKLLKMNFLLIRNINVSKQIKIFSTEIKITMK